MDPAAPMPTDGEGGGGSTNSGRPPQFVSKLYGYAFSSPRAPLSRCKRDRVRG